MQVLQDHATKMVLLASSHPTCVTSQGNYDQIWETIYSNINLCQVQQEEITNMPFCSTHHLFVDLRNVLCTTRDFPDGSDGKASAYNAGDPGSIPGLGRTPGEGNGNPLQYSCLENPMDGGTW